jgi:crotonobetainyl-CoA:carnitine CoA-transferase CaiB-like acyl-CoA transferase
MDDRTAAALAGIKVVEVGRYISGPYCGLFLADLGADVTKVETGEGDPSRREGPWIGTESLYFAQMNRNKRLRRINFRDPGGKVAITRLVGDADIVIENYRPSSAEAMGLDWPSVSRINPRAILVAISGFGFYGPDRDRGAFDEVIQSLTGMAYLSGEADQPPTLTGIHPIDATAGLLGAFGALAALIQRGRTGRGQLVEVSLIDAALALLNMLVPAALANGGDPVRTGNADRTSAPANAYRASDGWIYIHAGGDPFWQRAIAAMDLMDLSSDKRFSTEQARVTHRQEIDRIFGDWVSGRTVLEVETTLDEAGVLVAPVRTLTGAVTDPLLSMVDRLATITGTTGSAVPTLLAPVHLSESPALIRHWSLARGPDDGG